MKPAHGSAQTLLANEFRECVARVLESMSGEPHQSESACLVNKNPGCRWLGYKLSGPASGLVLIGVAPEQELRLGKLVLTAVGIDADEPSARSTCAELISQSVSAWSQELSNRLGGPIVADAGREAHEPQDSECCAVRILSGEEPPVELFVSLSSELVQQLVEPAKPFPEAHPAVPAADAGVAKPPALDLLMDVELPVSVSFGRAHLPIKEVLKLSAGSIVELARSVSEPVEMIVNNCVIARGEVVVIEGNYGLRIEEIVSAQERLRTLK
jgi:flagellar motor switch protein FliN